MVRPKVICSTSNFHVSSSSKVTKFDDFEPSCFEQACFNKVWMKVMNEEISSIVKNDTWELCKIPQTQV